VEQSHSNKNSLHSPSINKCLNAEKTEIAEKLPSMQLYHMQTSHQETKNLVPTQIPYSKLKGKGCKDTNNYNSTILLQVSLYHKILDG
jgi:hypothetical protein